jgi:potassium-transporting ATPase ATP-binding subunit
MSTATSSPADRKPEIKLEDGGAALISRGVRARPLFDREILRRAVKESFVKLNPVLVAKNPVMFVVEVGAALTTVFVVRDAISGAAGTFFGVQIALWLWFTVVFANFAEAMAEARGKAQADTLRKTKTDTIARRLLSDGKFEMVPASHLRAGDVVY